MNRELEHSATATRREADPLSRDPVVCVRGLTKRYGDAVAVDDLTFALAAGTITGFLGRNGAGSLPRARAADAPDRCCARIG